MEELLNFLCSLSSQKKKELTELKDKSTQFQKKYSSLTSWPKNIGNRAFFAKEIASLTELTAQLDRLISFWDKKDSLVNIVSENYRALNKKKSQKFDEEVYNLTNILKDKNNLISELEKQLKIKSELANEFFQKDQKNQDKFELEKEKLLDQINNYEKELEAAKIILADRDKSISEWEKNNCELKEEFINFKKNSFANIAKINDKQKLESKEAKQLIEELEKCLEIQIQAKETAESKLSQLTSPATPDHTQKSPLVRLRGFSGSFDEKMKLLEQKNQEAYNDLEIKRDELERMLDEEREKNRKYKNTSQNTIRNLRNELEKTTKKGSDLESDLKDLVGIINQDARIIQWKEETNSFLQIRLNELNKVYSKNFAKYRKTDNNLTQERVQHQATFRQLLDQETKNQQLVTENQEKQEKLETVEKKLTKLQLFYTRLDQDYKKSFTATKKLEEVYHLILSDYRKIKSERPDITIAEYDKLKKKITEKENTIFHLTEENSDLQEILTNQQAEINDLATNLTNITNQKNTLQTEKDNLQIELQNKDNELNSQRANFELERERKNKKITNLKTQLQDKNSENKALEQEIKNIQVKLEKKEKEIIQELNNSLNLNLSEPTLSAIINHIKELITPSPAFSDDICIRDLEIIKGIDLIDMEKFLSIQLSAKEKQQFQSTAINYQELVNFRHSFLKQHLAKTSIATQLSTTDKQLSKKENVLSVLLIMSLLIIVLQFIWMRKRSKKRVLANI